MFARMIARDFTRNRSVTVLLVVLMMLSVVLATASAGTLLLGLDNQPITEITPGTVVHHVYYQLEAGLKVGDPVQDHRSGRLRQGAHDHKLRPGLDHEPGADLRFQSHNSASHAP
jgi:hypothetical protein